MKVLFQVSEYGIHLSSLYLLSVSDYGATTVAFDCDLNLKKKIDDPQYNYINSF